MNNTITINVNYHGYQGYRASIKGFGTIFYGKNIGQVTKKALKFLKRNGIQHNMHRFIKV